MEMAISNTNNSLLKKLNKKPMKALRSIKKAASRAGRALRITKSNSKSDNKVATEVLEVRLAKMIYASNSVLLDIDQAMYSARLLTPRAQMQLLNILHDQEVRIHGAWVTPDYSLQEPSFSTSSLTKSRHTWSMPSMASD